MPQLSGEVIKDRARQLRDAGAQAARNHLAAQVGKTHRVLMETPQMGRTEHFAEVLFEAPQPEGQIVLAHVTDHNDTALLANPL